MTRPIMRHVALASLVLLLMGAKLKKLSDTEREHWRALRVFVEKKDQKRWLRLKSEEARNAWLKERGLWDKFYEHEDYVRDQIVSGDVRLGWDRDMLYMAWGAPTQKMRLTGRNASRSERLVYRFEVDSEGFATVLRGKNPDYKAVDRYQVNVIVDDDTVAELQELDEWSDG